MKRFVLILAIIALPLSPLAQTTGPSNGAQNSADYDYESEERLLSWMLERNETLLGDNDPLTISNLNYLANLYLSRQRYGKAEPLLIRALRARERTLGPEHEDTVTSVLSLAYTYYGMGRFAEAEPLYVRAFTAYERSLGPEDRTTLAMENNVGLVYLHLGRLSEAEQIFTRGLEVREFVLGPDDPDTLDMMHNLGSLYLEAGRYSEAEQLLIGVIAARGLIVGQEDDSLFNSVRKLGDLYAETSRPSEAISQYGIALDFQIKSLPADHPATLQTRSSIAQLFAEIGRVKEAESLVIAVLETRHRVLGPNHPDLLTSLNNLAVLYSDVGRQAEADSLYTRALEATKRILGLEHPQTLSSVVNLALLRFTVGEATGVAASVGELDRALASWTRRVGQELRAGASDALRANLAGDGSLRDVAVSAALTYPEHAALGARALLMTKGIAGETDAALARLVAMDPRPEVRTASDELRSAEGMLFAAYQSEDPEHIQAARVDRDVARSALYSLIDPPLAFQPDAIAPEVVLATLSPGEVFLDFGIFRPVDFQTGRMGDPHILLAAYRSVQGVTLFDLGPVAAVREAILLTTDASPRGQEMSLSAQSAWEEKVFSQHADLSRALLGPVASWLHDGQTLTISPDGILARVNFTALVDPDSQLDDLSARIPVRIVPTGRTLLQSAQDLPQPPVSETFLGVGLTDFGPHVEARCQTSRMANPEGGLCPLPNAVREVTQIAALFGAAPAMRTLLEAEATEAAVAATMPGTRFIHLTTHGGAQLAGIRTEGLNNVGLALHGIGGDPASARIVTAANDGILTGAEVARLTLAGTDLVVMSACDTALGDDAAAEGIWSMAHGFRLAGVNAVMMTLWKVNDDTAPAFMTQFYRTLLERQKTRPGEPVQTTLRNALRDTQGWAIAQDWSYWDYAPFVLVEN